MGKDLLSVSEAVERILSKINPVGDEIIPVGLGVGRTLAEPIVSAYELPLFTSSSMDGFAVRAANLRGASQANPKRLKIIGEIPAGSILDLEVEDGYCARIMTGAQLPAGADAVVPVEDTDLAPTPHAMETPESIQFYRELSPGSYVRHQGEDMLKGELMFSAGHVLQPYDIGWLAMLGIAEITVRRKPILALLSTGDELLQPGQPLQPGRIFESNSFTIAALLEEQQCTVALRELLPDDPTEIIQFFLRARNLGVDLILTSAGVSMGNRDFIRDLINDNGGIYFWRVDIRPGKPVLFGNFMNVPVIALPGNPVSAVVTFEVFVKPALAKLSGRVALSRQIRSAQLVEPIESDGRESYLRGEVFLQDENYMVRPLGSQSSADVRSLIRANAFIILPSEVKSLPIGSRVKTWIIRGNL